MNAKQTFDHLRKLAKAKRDQDIESAKESHLERLEQINQLERDLSFVDPKAARRPRATVNSTKDVIRDLAPEGVFTFDDLYALIANSGRQTASLGTVSYTHLTLPTTPYV